MDNNGPVRPIEDVNDRIDRCIKADGAGERVLWCILILMVCVGLFVLLYGVWHDNHYLIGASLGANGLSTWPIIRLIQLHRRKTALRVIPSITALLSARDAAREIHALIRLLLDKS